jgi:HEAT repeat protein
METQTERGAAVAGFLRQLWFGLATYRLYPDSPERSVFVTAAGLIEQAARSALETGPIDVEISPKGFTTPGLELRSDASMLRLARVCFERRAERLRVTSVPSVRDLHALFAALTVPVEELDRTGDLESHLSEVASVTLTRLGPSMRPGGGVEPVDGLAPEFDVSVETSAAIAALADDLSGSVDEQAELVLERLRETVSQGAALSPNTDVYARLCDALVGLPPELRRSVIGKLVEQTADDLLAERLVGSLSNTELSRAIVGLAGEGREPVEMARRLAETGVRMHDIVDFTAALQAGFEDAETIFAGLEQIGSPIDRLEGSSVSDALAEHLLATEPADLRDLHDLSVAGREQGNALGLATLKDYFLLETEPVQFELVAEVWARTTRKAVLRRDQRRVLELVSVMEGSRNPLDGRSFLEAYGPLVVDREVVSALVAGDGVSEGPDVFMLLAPFGEKAVDALFEELAEEEDRGRRAALLGLLRQLVPGRADPVVRRLKDPRWYVVRNAVNVLRYSRHPGSLDLLAEAARHAAEGVRREAVFGLAAGGVAAVPHLSALAVGPDAAVRLLAIQALGGLAAPEAATALANVVSGSKDIETRRRALDALAGHPSAEAASALAAFSTRSRPRLPRALRRHAQALVRARPRGAR